MRFSRRTLAALARVLSELNSHSDIDTLAYELSLEAVAIGPNKLSRCVALVKNLEKTCTELGSDKPIVELIQSVLASTTEWQFQDLTSVSGLTSGLQVDGFEYSKGILFPGTPQPAVLAPQISMLEQQLQAMRLNVASAQYKQAADTLVDGHFEAPNGQLRSFLQNLFIELCEIVTKKRFEDPTAALQHPKNCKCLEPKEWNMCRGFWDSCQSNGPHHGLTDSEEALFRLHMGTALARYLIHKFAKMAA